MSFKGGDQANQGLQLRNITLALRQELKESPSVRFKPV